MNFGAIVEIISKLLDRLPSRKEAILNRILEIKDEQRTLQDTKPWTEPLSIKYYTLSSELFTLEKRARNAGL